MKYQRESSAFPVHHFATALTGVVLLFCATAGLWGQGVSGTILGIVQDQQGGVIANASITAKNVETGISRTATANEAGLYRITGVPAGSYEVSATAAGFKPEARTGVIVTVGAEFSVNFSLNVGAVTETVEVTGQASQVDTTTSSLGGFVNSTTIRELPLNGRDWLQLSLLQPGVNLAGGQTQTDSSRAARGNGISITIAGARATDNVFRIDGLVVNDYANGGPGSALRVNMGVDAIREFTVLSNNASAEYGRTSGGVINAITKSGTNDIHGSAYYFHRNSALDARNFFDLQTVAPFRRHQYGGSLGGPIKKDKTFYFANYEGLTEKKSQTLTNTTISDSARQGIIAGSATPVTINPSVQKYLALYPRPNLGQSGDTGTFSFPGGRFGHEKYVIGKVDHNFTPATTLFGSYSYDDASVIAPDAFNYKDISSPSRRQNVLLTLQHIFTPTLINNTRAGVSRTYAGNNVDSNPRIPAITDPSYGFIAGQPMGSFTISGISGTPGGIGASGFNVYGYTAPQFYTDWTWTRGRHSIKTGFSFEQVRYNINAGFSPLGAWTFGSVSDFLQAKPNQIQVDIPGTSGARSLNNVLVGGYLQDDFRVRSNLTLNLGVRYEMGTVVTERFGRLSNLRNITDAKTTIGDPYYNNPTLKNFAPRFGFAWDPFGNGKTSIRGGISMFDLVPLPYLFQSRAPRSAPFFLAGVATDTKTLAANFPSNIVQAAGVTSFRASDVEFNPSRAYRLQWNLNIQRQLTNTIALTVGYVGSAGVHLPRGLQELNLVLPNLVTTSPDGHIQFPIPAAGGKIQIANPNFGTINGTQWNGHNSYHGMTVNLVQRPLKGLMYQVAYTWSKAIDNGSTTWVDNEYVNTAGSQYPYYPRLNRSVADYNVPQNFVVNALYEIPVTATMKKNVFSNTLLGGWQLGGIYTRQSGSPFSLKIGGDRALTGSTVVGQTTGYQAPDYVSGPGCSVNAVTGDNNNYILTKCFAFPALGTLGNLGRNTLRMPTYRDLDFSLYKNQNLVGERLKMQFRFEVFNIMNNTNLQAIVRTIFNANGQLQTNVVNAQRSAVTLNSARQLQFGLRFLF